MSSSLLLGEDPFVPGPADLQQTSWDPSPSWPADWIALPDLPAQAVVAYRCCWRQDAPAQLRLHCSADERFALYCDGVLVGRGPERGAPHCWLVQSYELPIAAGEHRLVALVWSLGERAPQAQMSVAHGWLLAVERGASPAQIATGRADWQARLLPGRSFTRGPEPAFVGAQECIDGAAWPWGIEDGEEDDEQWHHVPISERACAAHRALTPWSGHLLRPALLPAMLERPWQGGRVRLVDDGELAVPGDREAALAQPCWSAARSLPAEVARWQDLLDGPEPLSVPPHARRRVLIDLGDYLCAYPELVLSGGSGARVQLSWTESLFVDDADAPLRHKGDRSAIEGRRWFGIGDTVLPDGGVARSFRPLWWRCGCWLLCEIETAAEELRVEALRLHETRYPLEQEATVDLDLPPLRRVWPLMVRSLQMCAHETYMDCPYYEQLMYVGDTRLEALATYVLTADARLPRKALDLFAASRAGNGWTQSRYPSRDPQIIPPFSWWWICQLYDYALWRDDLDMVRALLPVARSVVEAGLVQVDDEGLVVTPPGWNFVDWVWDRHWRHGVPPDGGTGRNATLQWQWVLALQAWQALEAACGEPEQVRRAERLQGQARAACEAFWDASQGCYADDRGHRHHSQHAQCLALLGGAPADRTERLLRCLDPQSDLPPTSIYFSHYLFEAAAACGRADLILARLREWYDLAEQGFHTTRETPEPSRSDCHGWGAHPIYHAVASLVGLRPTAPGFRAVRIRPLLGDIPRARVVVPHPRGRIAVELEQRDGGLHGRIVLPPGIDGELYLDGGRRRDFRGELTW